MTKSELHVGAVLGILCRVAYNVIVSPLVAFRNTQFTFHPF